MARLISTLKLRSTLPPYMESAFPPIYLGMPALPIKGVTSGTTATVSGAGVGSIKVAIPEENTEANRLAGFVGRKLNKGVATIRTSTRRRTRKKEKTQKKSNIRGRRVNGQKRINGRFAK